MEKLGMHHDPRDGFDHPELPEGYRPAAMYSTDFRALCREDEPRAATVGRAGQDTRARLAAMKRTLFLGLRSDWVVARSLDLGLGAGWRVAMRAWAEASDRDETLRFAAPPTRIQQALGADLGLLWMPASPPK
jgi:hypothetical protein